MRAQRMDAPQRQRGGPFVLERLGFYPGGLPRVPAYFHLSVFLVKDSRRTEGTRTSGEKGAPSRP